MALAISMSYSASVEMAARSFKSSSCSSCPSLPASCLSRWSTWLHRRLSPVHLGHLLVHHGYSQEVWSGLPAPLPLFGTTPPPNRTPPLKDFSRVEEVALYGFKVCQVVTMLSLRSSKGGQKWSSSGHQAIPKGFPSGWLIEVMKTGKRRFHPQIDFFYSLHELAVDLVLLFVLPFCPINWLTDSLGMPLVTLSYLKKHLRPTFSSSEPVPSTLVFSDSQTSASSSYCCWWPALAVSPNQIPRHSLLSKLVVCDPLSPSSTWADRSHLPAPFLEKSDCSQLSKRALNQDCRFCRSPNDKSGSPAIATGPPDSPR